MHIPRPDTRTLVLLLAAALVLLLVGMLLKGVAYLLVVLAAGLAIYAFLARRSHDSHPVDR